MQTIFTLAGGRSGTTFLANFVKKNVSDCYATHEPYFDLTNPTLFGKPILFNATKQDQQLEVLLAKKVDRIRKFKTAHYFESNHAIVKAADRYLPDMFADLGLVHLIREPRYVAKSELNRELLIRKLKIPFMYYKGLHDEMIFKWTLTGYEDIYQNFDLNALSRYQFYLIQWIEVENRIIKMLKNNQLESRCFRLHVPADINDAKILKEMVDFFDLQLTSEISLDLRKNTTPLAPKTEINEREQREFKQVIAKLPTDYLKIFSEYPYNQYDWAKDLAA